MAFSENLTCGIISKIVKLWLKKVLFQILQYATNGHFRKYTLKKKSLSSVQLFEIPWTVVHQAPLSWNSPGKNIGVGCHFILQNVHKVSLHHRRKNFSNFFHNIFELEVSLNI